MKKILVSGYNNIFQLARCYRNREYSSTHHPEFTMLEWYRTKVSYTKIMEDCEALLKTCVQKGSGVNKIHWNGLEADLSEKFERLSVCEAFVRYTGIDLVPLLKEDPLRPEPGAFAGAAQKIGIKTQANDTWDDIFFRIFLEKIEAKLGLGRPTILYDYPACMSALSRIKTENPLWCERFELYVCGLELANAFSELTDASEQAKRFAEDMDKKEQIYGFRYPIDADFLKALQHGYPESAGIALGVDRLIMLIAGADHIEKVLWAPVL